MSKMAQLQLDMQDAAIAHGDIDDDRLLSAAVALKGEIEGGMVVCPSPGMPADDRSMWVRLDPSGQPFIYMHEGSLGAAYAHVRRALGSDRPRVGQPEAVERLWAGTQSGDNTSVQAYLRSRAILLPVPPALRFHPSLKHQSGRWPGMVAERVDVSGRRVSVHRTFLRPDGSGKAPVEPPRKDLGPTAGTAIRLTPAAEELAVGEGIETCLSYAQLSSLATWAAGSAPDLKRLVLPPEVRLVVIAADGDQAGIAAARFAKARWVTEGRKVTIHTAPAGKDFNDLLRERAC